MVAQVLLDRHAVDDSRTAESDREQLADRVGAGQRLQFALRQSL